MLSIVVPVYNSQTSLPELLSRLNLILPACGSQFEIIFVNDGSRDQSWALIESFVASYPWVRGINLMRNFGQGNALLCGIRAAEGETIITMDDDLQHPPEEIPKLLAALTPDFDVVFGSPGIQKHDFLRNLASRLTKLALKSGMGATVAEFSGPFRAFRRCLREGFANYESSYVSIDVLLTFATTRFTYVLVAHHTRQYGQSNYTLQKLIAHAINLITGFSAIPLQFASLIGMLFSLIGFVLLAYTLIRVITIGIVVPGFAFLASMVAIFSGVQLLAIGIIGEYLARMYGRTLGRPTYVIKEKR